MLLSNASNAVLSKAMAMYGKRLTIKDYNSLLNCTSVSEVVNYLKNHTHYNVLLEKENESQIHRGRLEFLLRQELLRQLALLCKYEISVGEEIYEFITEKTVVEELSRFLILFSAGKSNEYLYSLSLYFNDIIDIDLTALPNVKNYSDLLNILKGSRYYDAFNNHKPSNGIIDKTSIENDLYKGLYDHIFEIIRKHTRGKERKQLENLFMSNLNAELIEKAIRLKKFYGLKGSDLKEKLLPYSTFSESQINAICNAEKSKDIFKIIERTGTGHKIKKIKYAYSGEISEKLIHRQCKNNMRFSTYPSVILLSYMFLAGNELKNIISIIEGVRYNVSPETIKSILIY